MNKNKKLQSIDVADIDLVLDMLTRHLNTEDIKPLLSSLQTLKTDPQNEQYHELLVAAFNDLGAMQGAVLTYAPYLNIFVCDDPFAD